MKKLKILLILLGINISIVCLGQTESGNKIILSYQEVDFLLKRDNDATFYQSSYEGCKERESDLLVKIKNLKVIYEIDSILLLDKSTKFALEKQKTDTLVKIINKKEEQINSLKKQKNVLKVTTLSLVVGILIETILFLFK